MKTIIFPIIALLFSLSISAQPDGRDKIKALKVSFITERLELTATEAEQFWPIYNAYEEVTLKLKFEELRGIRHEIKTKANTLSNERASELLEKMTKAENRIHDEEVKLNSKLQKIISAKKIILLKVAEEDFKKKLFDQFKKMRREGKK